MKKSELRKIIKEEILKENWLGQEQIDRFEGTVNMRDLKTLQDMLRIVGHQWFEDGFLKEDIKDYINYYIDQI